MRIECRQKIGQEQEKTIRESAWLLKGQDLQLTKFKIMMTPVFPSPHPHPILNTQAFHLVG